MRSQRLSQIEHQTKSSNSSKENMAASLIVKSPNSIIGFPNLPVHGPLLAQTQNIFNSADVRL